MVSKPVVFCHHRHWYASYLLFEPLGCCDGVKSPLKFNILLWQDMVLSGASAHMVRLWVVPSMWCWGWGVSLVMGCCLAHSSLAASVGFSVGCKPYPSRGCCSIALLIVVLQPARAWAYPFSALQVLRKSEWQASQAKGQRAYTAARAGGAAPGGGPNRTWKGTGASAGTAAAAAAAPAAAGTWGS